MRNLNDWLLLLFWTFLGALAIIFAFYVASLLLPIVLFLIAVSGLTNLFSSIHKRNQANEHIRVKIEKNPTSQKSSVIDAEYEVIDDK